MVITTSAPLEAHQPIESDVVAVRYIHAVKVLEVAEAGDALVRDLACETERQSERVSERVSE